MPTSSIRPATLADEAILCAHRRAMFLDMGHTDTVALDAMEAAFRPWLQRQMAGGNYLAWLAVTEDGAVAAGLGVWLMDWLPHLIGPGAPRANIVNVYTDPAWRRLGLARQLVDLALHWCREHGIRAVILHSSDAGRPLYQALGFRPTNEMRLLL